MTNVLELKVVFNENNKRQFAIVKNGEVLARYDSYVMAAYRLRLEKDGGAA